MAGATLLGLITQITILTIISSLLLVLVCIGALVLLQIYIVGRALSTAARGGDMWQASVARFGLLPDDLDELPSAQLNPRMCEASDCAICLEGFQPGEWCRALPQCGHVFHVQCADSWLTRAAVCPLCRRMVAGVLGGAYPGREVVRRVDLLWFQVAGD